MLEGRVGAQGVCTELKGPYLDTVHRVNFIVVAQICRFFKVPGTYNLVKGVFDRVSAIKHRI